MTQSIDPAALLVLRAQARTVAGYRRSWQRGLAACRADGTIPRDSAGAAQAFAHHSAGRKLFGDGVAAALVGVRLRGEAFMEHVCARVESLLVEAAATLPPPSPYRHLCCWCGRGATAHVAAPVVRDGDGPPLLPDDPARLWHDRCWSERLAERMPGR